MAGYADKSDLRTRIGLVILAAPTLGTGLWALLAPRSWYDDYTHGLAPPSAFGDYTAHFIQDVGGAYLAVAALLIWALVSLRSDVVRAALVGFVAFSAPHLVIHLVDRGDLDTRGYLFVNAVQVLGLALAVWVGILNSRRGAADA